MSCSIPGCPNVNNEKCRQEFPDLCFIRFPKEPRMRLKWFNIIKQYDSNWIWHHQKAVCSIHFLPREVTRAFRRPAVKKVAVPTLNLPFEGHETSQKCSSTSAIITTPQILETGNNQSEETNESLEIIATQANNADSSRELKIKDVVHDLTIDDSSHDSTEVKSEVISLDLDSDPFVDEVFAEEDEDDTEEDVIVIDEPPPVKGKPQRRKGACEICGGLHSKKHRNCKETKKTISHEQNYEFQCGTCMKRYKFAKNLNRHTTSMCREKNTRRFYCEICLEDFSTWQIRDKHVKTHMDPTLPYQCPYCEEPFTSRLLISKHMKKKHQIGRKEGPQCSKTSSNGGLKNLPRPQSFQHCNQYDECLKSPSLRKLVQIETSFP